MARFSRLRPINSVKLIRETSGIIPASTNTVLSVLRHTVPAYALADTNGVPVGSKSYSFFFSFFAIAEGGEVAAEVPLVDWYIIFSPGGVYASTFSAALLPTPGATGAHLNKRQIIHTEKGLAGGGDASTAGVPMIFKGVIKIPKRMQRAGEEDELVLCARTNFNTKFCSQAIYKFFN